MRAKFILEQCSTMPVSTSKAIFFRSGLHWLVGTAKGPFHDIWKETNVITDSVKIIDHEVHTKIFDEQGNDFTVYTDIDRWERYLIDIAPEDAVIIKKMCAEMRKASLLEPFSAPPEMRGLWDYIHAIGNCNRTLVGAVKT